MSYLIEATIGDRTYHYGSEHAYREDMEIRGERIRSLKAYIAKENSNIEKHRKDTSEAATMQVTASKARIAYLEPMLKKEKAERVAIAEACLELLRQSYA